jgi:hypothetical protein
MTLCWCCRNYSKGAEAQAFNSSKKTAVVLASGFASASKNDCPVFLSALVRNDDDLWTAAAAKCPHVWGGAVK